MSKLDPTPDDSSGWERDSRKPNTRLKLLWDVVLFQAKLAADGLRDVALVPISLVAAIIGFVAGGKDPAQYFNRVLQFGRRTEIWINLFGYRKHSNTSDALLKPLEDKVIGHVQNNPTFQKAEAQLNRSLEGVQKRAKKGESPDPP